MKTTGLFCVHEVVINAEIGKTYKLIPVGDVHRESPLHSDGHWREFLDYAKKQPDALFLGMGDYMDGCSTSERTIINTGGLHESTTGNLRNMYRGVTETLAKELAFTRGRWLGMLGGNHYYDLEAGENTDMLLASKLGAKFLGVCAFIRVTFKIKRGKDRTHGVSLDIFAHHGKGGGHLPGSTFNSLERMLSSADADIYLMGHDHRKGCIPSTPRLRLTQGGGCIKVREREPWLGRTGSFLKAYEDGKVSYNVDAARSACSLGWIEFDLTPTRSEANDDDVMSVRIRGTS